jgi:hypothetical protein
LGELYREAAEIEISETWGIKGVWEYFVFRGRQDGQKKFIFLSFFSLLLFGILLIYLYVCQ